MLLDQEEDMCLPSHDGWSTEGCLWDDVSKSGDDDGWDDTIDLLPCNIIDLWLPNDPFGMELSSVSWWNDAIWMCYPFGTDIDDIEAMIKAIAGWVNEYRLRAHEDNITDTNNFFAKLNVVVTGSVDTDSEAQSNEGSYEQQDQTMFLGDDTGELTYFGFEKYQREEREDENGGENQGRDPVDGFTFVLNYLGLKDLLSVGMVCRSLRDTIRDDALLWRRIHVDYPLSDKITDDILLRLTSRAQGLLSSLSLERCMQITNAGLHDVLRSNPRLTKLSVSGCRIKLERLLHELKAFNSASVPGIKCLRIGDIYGMTNEMFSEFKCLLGVDETKKSMNYNPRYCQAAQSYLPLDDERPIDIETCPICKKARQVYDCPIENCQVEEDGSTKPCRGCTFCIARCRNCGCCLVNRVHVETFSFELLCLDCFKVIFNYDEHMALSPRHAYFHQMTGYRFYLYS